MGKKKWSEVDISYSGRNARRLVLRSHVNFPLPHLLAAILCVAAVVVASVFSFPLSRTRSPPSASSKVTLTAFGQSPNDPTYTIDVVGGENFRILADTYVRFFIDSTGKVGIGTATPAYQLDVNGGIRASGLDVSGTIRALDVYAAGGQNLVIGDDTYLTDIDVANTVGLYGLQDSTRAGIKLGSGGPTLHGYNGNLGIGTTTPSKTLSVVGDLLLSGGGRTICGDADARLNIYHNRDADASRTWIELWGGDPSRAGELTLGSNYISFRTGDTGAGSIGNVAMTLDNAGRLRDMRAILPPTSISGFTFENFGGIFPAVVCASSSRPWGNDPGWKDWTDWPYPTGRAITYLPSGGWWEQGLRGVQGSQAYWFFIGKAPASTLYFYVGYVDDYVDVYVKDVTTGAVFTLVDTDGYGDKQITNSMTLTQDHEYIIFVYWEDTGYDETLQFQFWFGGTKYF